MATTVTSHDFIEMAIARCRLDIKLSYLPLEKASLVYKIKICMCPILAIKVYLHCGKITKMNMLQLF